MLIMGVMSILFAVLFIPFGTIGNNNCDLKQLRLSPSDYGFFQK